MGFSTKNKILRSDSLFLLLIPLGFILYMDVLGAAFVYDDKGYIITNLWIRSLRNFLDFSGTRYIGFLSFALNYAVSGLVPFDYHMVNILIHISNSVIFFFLIRKTFETPSVSLFFEERRDARTVSLCLAFCSSVIFLSHPVESQAVSYITQRFASLATFFYISAVLLYVKARLAWMEVRRSGGRKIKARCFYFASLASTILAMKTKEISFTIPFMIVLYDFVFFGSEFKKGVLLRIPYYLTLFIIPLTLLGFDQGLTGHGAIGNGLRNLELNEATGLPRDIYFLTELSVVVTYLRLLLFPVNQAVDYDYHLSRSIFEPHTFLSFILLLSIFAFAVFVLKTSRRTGNAWGLFFSFGILWFFIALSVESSIMPIQDVIFEQRVYLPSMGFFISIFSALFYFLEYLKMRRGIKISHAVASALVLLMVFPPLAVALNMRNKLWCDEILLLNEAIGKYPQKGRLYYARGLVYFGRQKYMEALEDTNRAISINYTIKEIYNLRGLSLSGLEKYPEAIENFSRAISARAQSDDKVYMNRGIAYAAIGRYEEALKDINKSLEKSPDNKIFIESQAFSKILNELKLACGRTPMKGCEALEKKQLNSQH